MKVNRKKKNVALDPNIVTKMAQQIRDKLKSNTITPLAVKQMAQRLREKMKANSETALMTTNIDSSEVTIPSPVPNLGNNNLTLLMKENTVVKPNPTPPTSKKKFGNTYQRKHRLYNKPRSVSIRQYASPVKQENVDSCKHVNIVDM